jgi:hypothetical protein
MDGKLGAGGNFFAWFGSLIIQVNLAAGHCIGGELARFEEARSP